MKFIEVTQPGEADVLKLSETEVPVPKENEVLIKVMAAGVNRPDIAQRKGLYPPPPGASPILGLEVSGKVVAVGANSKWRIDDEVCALTPGGGYAEYCIAPDVQCLPLPRGFSVIEAAGIPETFFTVWANVFILGGLKAGDKFLVHGGSSGIGTTAIQLAKAFGAEVFATAGTDLKCDACCQLGATSAINYKQKDFVEELKKLTSGIGIDVILDMIGGSYTPKNIECLAVKGRLVQIATMQGAEVTVNLMKLMQKRALITGSTLRPRSIGEKGEIAKALLGQVWPLLSAGKVKVVIDRVFSFAQAGAAHAYLEKGQHVGKIILSFTD
jgi:NADPH2:quinone reductase